MPAGPVPEGVHLPPGSIWPFIAPIGLFLVVLALALGGGGSGTAAGPEQVNGIAFSGQVLDGFDAKGLRGAVDEAKQRLGSGVAALVAVNDGRG